MRGLSPNWLLGTETLHLYIRRLFSYHTYIDIPDTLLHKKLGISKNGSKYIYGKNDLFSVVITFRYLLPKTDFFTV